jgi:hypothetical protein
VTRQFLFKGPWSVWAYTKREVRSRYHHGYPWRIVVGGLWGPLTAWWTNDEWVGCQGGLRWSREFGWE